MFHLSRVATIAALLTASAATAEPVVVEYLIHQKAFKAGATGTDTLAFELYEDESCTTQIGSYPVFVNDPYLHFFIDKRQAVAGAPKLPRAIRIHAAIDAPTTASAPYLMVTGPGVAPMGEVCQLQAGSPVAGSGPTGAQGPAGAAGAQGPAGADGVQGPAGAGGAQGPAGADGAPGPAGADGAQGPAGADGAPGPAGADGAQGPAGADGAQGPAGADGAQGPAGADGAQGPAGADGAQGPAGADGAQGPAGADGAQGPAGADGAQGPAGADGAQGPAGADGAQGPAGADGAQGPAGADGAQGPSGADGAQGPAGADGAQGPAGADGAQGPSGADGAQGPAGPAGADGADGTASLVVEAEVSQFEDGSSTTVTLGAATDRVCFLTTVDAFEVDATGERGSCTVSSDGANWSLTADAGSGNSTVNCSARCLSW